MKTKTCPDCNGDGVVDKGTDDEHQCPTCGGCGFVPDDDDDEEVVNTSSRRSMIAFVSMKSLTALVCNRGSHSTGYSGCGSWLRQ